MFATILSQSDAIGIFLALCVILWFLKDCMKAANGPVSRGLWDLFRRGR
jgi:hypothetical protein